MTDSALVLDPLAIVLDDNGAAAGGATLDFYVAGTSTPLTVYSDSALSSSIGTSITCDANGVPSYGGNPTLIYTGATTYKVTITPGGGSTVRTYDNVRGALDTSSFAPTSASPKLPVSTHNEDVTLTASDLGKTHEGDASGGNFTFFLPTAVTATNGIETAFRNIGSSGVITIAPIAGQTIDGRVGLALADQYQAVRIVPDGANWHIVSDAPKFKETAPYFTVQDRLTAPPTSPTPGACYIINGTPTGAWASYAQNDLVIATGTGSWAKFTPSTGWKAWIVDEDVESVFYDSAWTDYSNVTAPSTSALKIAVFSDEKAQNTQGGTPTANAWTKHDLQTERSNTITGASLASSVITLPTGKYMIHAQVSLYATAESQIRLRNTTDSSTIAISPQMYGSNYTSGTGPASILSSAGTVALGYVDVTEATETIELQYYVTNGPSSGLGRVRNVSSENEVYAVVTILDLTSIQGPTGSKGAQGADGLDAAFDYQWSTATSGDPGAGKALMDNATFASVTQINISETTASGANIAAVLAMMDDSTNDNKCLVRISKEGAPQNYKAFVITAAGTDQGSYWTFPVTPVDDDGTISNADDLAILFVPYGDKGATGATGAKGSAGATGATGAAGPTVAIGFNYSTTTADADPGSGIFRLNNATLASVTEAYFDNNERGGTDVSAWLDSFDDSGESTYRGLLLLIDTADSTEFQLYKVTGSVTDGTGYRKVSLTWVAGKASGSFTNGGEIAVSFLPRGASGAGDMATATYDPAGVAEQLVGLTATQTLTGKTHTSPDITVASTPTAPSSGKLRLYGVAAPGSADTLAYKNVSGLVRYLATYGAEVLIPENYGAIGDNSTNDYTALQAMFDSVSNVGVTQKHRPTIVLFTPGKIYVTGTTLKIQQYNVHVLGMGAGIRMTGTGPALMVDHANSVNSVPGVNISGLHIQANTGAGDHCIHARSAPQIRITDCHFKDFASAGTSTVCCGGHAILLEGCVSSTVADNEIDKPGGSGIYVKTYNKNYSGQPTPTGDTTSGSPTVTSLSSVAGISAGMGVSGTGIPADTVVNSVDSGTEITLSNNATANGTGVTLTFSVLAESQAVTIERNRVFNAASLGILVSEGGGMKIYNNDIEGCTGGMEVRSSYHFEVISNYFENNSTDIAIRNTVDEIAAREVLGGLIVGNTCESTAGINLVDGDDIHVFHNRISGTATIASACARALWGPQSEMTGTLTDSSTTTRYMPTLPIDPGADRLLFWDDSAGSYEYLTAGSGLSLTGTTLTATGTMGGSTGATDNRVLRADGTGGATLQNSPVTIDDSGNLSGVATLHVAGNWTLGGAGTLGVGGSAGSDASFYLDAGKLGTGDFIPRGNFVEKLRAGTSGVIAQGLEVVGTAQVDTLRIDQTPTAVGTGTKTISNASDSSTNFGSYLSINLNGTTYYIPCSSVAPT